MDAKAEIEREERKEERQSLEAFNAEHGRDLEKSASTDIDLRDGWFPWSRKQGDAGTEAEGAGEGDEVDVGGFEVEGDIPLTEQSSLTMAWNAVREQYTKWSMVLSTGTATPYSSSSYSKRWS